MSAAWLYWQKDQIWDGETNGKLMERCPHPATCLFMLSECFIDLFMMISFKLGKGWPEGPLNWITNVCYYRPVAFYHTEIYNFSIYICCFNYKAATVLPCEALFTGTFVAKWKWDGSKCSYGITFPSYLARLTIGDCNQRNYDCSSVKLEWNKVIATATELCIYERPTIVRNTWRHRVLISPGYSLEVPALRQKNSYVFKGTKAFFLSVCLCSKCFSWSLHVAAVHRQTGAVQ